MITTKQQMEIEELASRLYATRPSWVAFYDRVLGLRGIVRRAFPSREMLAAFEKTPTYQEILRQLAELREQGPMPTDDEDTRVITVRLPKSLHDTLRVEAHEHRTSMNKLCISKLLQLIDGEDAPTETAHN